jgi:ribosomal protein S18 acetylase RimI-like enzyme
LSALRIRAAHPADAHPIARVHVQAWHESYRGLIADTTIAALSVEHSGRMWADILAQDQQTSVVLVVERASEHGHEIVGFGSAGTARGAALGATGEIMAIYLLDGVKRRGLGRSLLTELLHALAARDHRSAGLWVLADNHGTRRFYETLGGRMGATRESDDSHVQMREIAYVWDDLTEFSRATMRGRG